MGKGKIKVMGSTRGYDLAAASYDEREAYLNSFEKKQLLPLLGDVTGKRVLDVGAGTGRVSIPLQQSGANVIGLDVSEKMLEKLRKKNRKIETVVGEAEALPFEDGSFDVVVAAFLIVHLKDSTRFFDEAYRVLKSDGLLLVTNINQKDPPVVKTEEGEIVIESYYHRPERVREILESLAFSIEKEIFVKEKEIWVDQIILAKK
jgi:ubiquinone/menaquinone biosynthesis C-methylase UbiE